MPDLVEDFIKGLKDADPGPGSYDPEVYQWISDCRAVAEVLSRHIPGLDPQDFVARCGATV